MAKDLDNATLARKEVGARIALRMLRASHIMERDANKIALGAGLTLQQWFLLQLLLDEGGTTRMGRMARFATVTRQKGGAMGLRMVTWGGVTTARDPKDRRSALVTLTDEGRRRISLSTPLRDRWTEEVFHGLSDADLQTADRILRTLYRSVASRAAPSSAAKAEPDTLW